MLSFRRVVSRPRSGNELSRLVWGEYLLVGLLLLVVAFLMYLWF